MIDLHISDLHEVGRPLLRSKAKCLEKLKADLGSERLNTLNRERLIAFGKSRAREGAGPVTVGMDLDYVRTILVHASAVYGIDTPTEDVTLASVALRRLGVVGKGMERDRRPTQDELDRIIAYHDNNPRQSIPVGRIVKFAVAVRRQRPRASSRWTRGPRCTNNQTGPTDRGTPWTPRELFKAMSSSTQRPAMKGCY